MKVITVQFCVVIDPHLLLRFRTWHCFVVKEHLHNLIRLGRHSVWEENWVSLFNTIWFFFHMPPFFPQQQHFRVTLMLPLWPDVLRSWSPALRGGPSGFIKRMMAAKVVPGRDGRSERKKTFYILLWTNITQWFLLKRTWTWTTFLRTTLFGLGSFHTVVCTRIIDNMKWLS